MNHSAALRRQLRTRADAWAAQTRLPHYVSLGHQPTLLFEATLAGEAHGNFHRTAWEEIIRRPEWAARLSKPHSRKSALPEAKRAGAKELDSTNSSDALLMNCFCFPNASPTILAGLGLPAQAGYPEFGYSPMLALRDRSTDSTEVDMRIGSLFFEAKLTEPDFTSRPKSHVFRYCALTTVFDMDRLPGTATAFSGYQLIRNILAAHQHQAGFVLLVDKRRPDLQSEWHWIAEAISLPALKARCQVRTWQDVAGHAPADLARFLDLKYGL